MVVLKLGRSAFGQRATLAHTGTLAGRHEAFAALFRQNGVALVDSIDALVEICHGAPFDEDYYLFDSADAARAIETARGRLCFFGHTHLPAAFASSQDPLRPHAKLETDELFLPRVGPALVNVGSVGQPRDGDPRAAYGILDTTRQVLRMRRVNYDIGAAQARIREAGLPAYLALRLERGQ